MNRFGVAVEGLQVAEKRIEKLKTQNTAVIAECVGLRSRLSNALSMIRVYQVPKPPPGLPVRR